MAHQIHGSHMCSHTLPMLLASTHVPTIMVAAYGILGMFIMPLFNKHAMRNMQYVLHITRWCSFLVLVVTSESTWRLTHEGGNHGRTGGGA